MPLLFVLNFEVQHNLCCRIKLKYYIVNNAGRTASLYETNVHRLSQKAASMQAVVAEAEPLSSNCLHWSRLVGFGQPKATLQPEEDQESRHVWQQAEMLSASTPSACLTFARHVLRCRDDQTGLAAVGTAPARVLQFEVGGPRVPVLCRCRQRW